MLINFFSWLAVFLLAISYWFQIYKIHIHKEVRDLSVSYHLLLATGFGILGITAYMEGSTIFLAKQILTTIPVIIILGQIYVHRSDSWIDSSQNTCPDCAKILSPNWIRCPWCLSSQYFSKNPEELQTIVQESQNRPVKRYRKSG